MSTQESDVIETITLQVRAGDGGRPLAVTQQDGTLHDIWGYRLAVGAVGLGLIAFLIGAAVIVATGATVPSQYWTSGSAISGALLGILAPDPARKEVPSRIQPPTAPPTKLTGLPSFLIEKSVAAVVGLVHAIEDLWSNRAVLILAAVFGVAVWRTIEDNTTEWQALAAAAGGALIGTLAPPPKKSA